MFFFLCVDHTALFYPAFKLSCSSLIDAKFITAIGFGLKFVIIDS